MKRSKLQLKKITLSQLTPTDMRNVAGGSYMRPTCDGICSSSDPCPKPQ